MASPADAEFATAGRRGERSWKGVSAAFLLVAVIVALALRSGEHKLWKSLPPEIRPFHAPKLSHLPQFLGDYREQLLWGTYSSGYYFGMRTTEPSGLQAGLMWFDPAKGLQSIRHQAQDRDGLSGFGWESHNGQSFGRQELHDGSLHLTTSFVKHFCKGCRGGDWSARLQASASTQASEETLQDPESFDQEGQRVSLFFYIADIQEAQTEKVEVVAEQHGGGYLLASGSTEPFGGWKLHVMPSPGVRLPSIKYLGLRSHVLHNLTSAVSHRINNPTMLASLGRRTRHDGFSGQRFHLPNEIDHDSNVAVFQMTVAPPFAADFIFTGSLSPVHTSRRWLSLAKEYLSASESRLPKWPAVNPPALSLTERLDHLSGRSLDKLLQDEEDKFDEDFMLKFDGLHKERLPEGVMLAAKAGLSNMLGGIGFFHGRSMVKVGDKTVEAPPATLLTAVPSRSFFPRGFLWDEGFHQLVIRSWDKRLSRNILASWLDLLNSDGWIAREQILGEEARSRVPAEFVVQDPSQANPPTLILVLADMARNVADKGGSTNPEVQEDLQFLQAAFPRMLAWLEWFVKTQRGKLPGSWRWRGRSLDFLPDPVTGGPSSFSRELNPKTLSSGLDDYPRASHPSDDERHLDLYCWMALATSLMTNIADHLGIKSPKIHSFRQLAEQLTDLNHLNKRHYDPSRGQYLDWGNHTEDVWLDWRYVDIPQKWQAQAGASRLRHDFVRHVGTPPKLRYVPHYGYVSLFPLMMRLLPEKSPELATQLHHLRTGQVLTPHGLRSLSKTSSLHGKRNTEHDPPYWRGPVWMNVNFLVLAALDHYSKVDGPQAFAAGKLHNELRSTLMQTLAGTYEKSGYLWENYDEETGEGRGCRPFTGWSALLVLIAGKSYPQM